jgi:hypothetical protein
VSRSVVVEAGRVRYVQSVLSIGTLNKFLDA